MELCASYVVGSVTSTVPSAVVAKWPEKLASHGRLMFSNARLAMRMDCSGARSARDSSLP